MDRVIVVRAREETRTPQGLPAFVGVSGRTAGASGLTLSFVVVPPGAVSEPHYHHGFETAIYQLSGRVETRFGPRLEEAVVTEAGDFLFIPPGLPHQTVNLSATEEARAVVARNDPRDEESVVLYDSGDAARVDEPSRSL